MAGSSFEGSSVSGGQDRGKYRTALVVALASAFLAVGLMVTASGPRAAVAQTAPPTYTAVAWGWNDLGQTDVPAAARSGVKAISAGHSHSLALKGNGTVVAWGHDDQGQTDVPAGLTGVKAIAAGWLHSLALKEDGTVVAWGNPGNVPAGLTNVKAISAGGISNLALKEEGTIVTWGHWDYEKPDPPAGLTGVRAISAGSYHGLALAAVTPPPGPVTSFSAEPGDGQVSLSWTNPADDDFWYTRVLRSTTGFASSPDPNADQVQITYTDGESLTDSFAYNGNTYYYTAFARDANGGWSTPATASATPMERTRPTIVRLGPPEGASGVAFDRNVAARFSEPMDESSLTTSTFVLKKQGTTGRLDATVRYVADDYTYRAVLDPADRLESGATYTATMTTGAKDVAGNALTGVRSWTFTVSEDATPPEVVGISPEDGAVGVATNSPVRTSFSEEMRERTLNANTVRLRKEGTATRVAASVSYDPSSRTVTLDPNKDLEPGTTYIAIVTNGVKDPAGNKLSESKVWRFTVEGPS